MSHRFEVLRLYRKIIRGGKQWTNPHAKSDAQIISEKEYILDEARTLFRKNKSIMDEEIIESKVWIFLFFYFY
jgi:hypothetical protein